MYICVCYCQWTKSTLFRCWMSKMKRIISSGSRSLCHWISAKLLFSFSSRSFRVTFFLLDKIQISWFLFVFHLHPLGQGTLTSLLFSMKKKILFKIMKFQDKFFQFDKMWLSDGNFHHFSWISERKSKANQLAHWLTVFHHNKNICHSQSHLQP